MCTKKRYVRKTYHSVTYHSKDPLHAFWSCKEVESAWSSFNCFHHSSSPQPLNFSDFYSLGFCRSRMIIEKKVNAILAWFLWNRRNAIHFGHSVHPTANIIELAGNLLQDFLAAQELDPMMPSPPILHQWHPPELN